MGKTKSLASNSFYYMIYNVLNILFPFLTGIYVSRVLLPYNIGEIQYAQNIVQYFVIFAYLGLPTYGLREVSKIRGNRDQLDQLYSELFSINLLSSAFFSVVYLVLILSVRQFRNSFPVYCVVGIAIALNSMNISWLFEGLEEFKFISVRNIVFKTVVFFSLILFVRNESDYLKYALITVIGTAGNYFVNILYSKRFVTLSFKDLNLKRHLKPVILLVTVNLAIEIYSLVDVTMLGVFCSKENVAYYSYGHRIQRILLQVINTFTMVTVPRLSYHFQKNEREEFNSLLSKTLSVIIILSIPMMLGILFVGSEMVTVLYGERYIRSAYVLQILSPLLLISPVGYLLGSRVLLVSNQESKMLVSVAVGAVVNVIGNYFLIQAYEEYGAAIASVISEIVVMIIYIALGKKYFALRGIKNTVAKTCRSGVIMCLQLFILGFVHAIPVIWLFLRIIAAVIVYFSIMLIQREDMVMHYYVEVKNKLKRI